MSSSTNRRIRLWGGVGKSGSWTTKYYDVLGIDKYQQISPFTLNSIYLLTREAAVVNSLYIDFRVNLATPSVYYL